MTSVSERARGRRGGGWRESEGPRERLLKKSREIVRSLEI